MNVNLVVFRKWKDSGDLIALFPDEPSDINGWYCNSYEHVGQHGGANYHGVIAQTTPATFGEYASLVNELNRIGYNVKPIKRASSCHHERRRQTAKTWRETDTS